jgi:hypothetical protein
MAAGPWAKRSRSTEALARSVPVSSLELASDQEALNQGSVVDEAPWGLEYSPLGIVLTNPCDLSWEKASFVLLAALHDAKGVIQASKEFRTAVADAPGGQLSRRQKGSLDRLIRRFVDNSDIRRYFFIEAAALRLPPLVVDFQHLLAVRNTAGFHLRSLALLPPPHREKLIVHFASYVSRIGVERFADEKAKELIRAVAEPYDV